jgi:cell wall-associated NlpC family hydrolase
VGRTLRLPSVVSHSIQKGDTLFSIAKKYGSSVDAIQRENKLGSGGLAVGKVLKVPLGMVVKPAPVKPVKPEQPTVQTPQSVQVIQPQSVQVVQPQSVQVVEAKSGASSSLGVFQPLVPSQPIATAKPDLAEPATVLLKPPPRGQGVQLVNPQALPMTVVTLPEKPAPKAEVAAPAPKAEVATPAPKAEVAAPAPKAEVVAPASEASKSEAAQAAKTEPAPTVESPGKDEPLVKTEAKDEVAPAKAEPSIAKVEPSIAKVEPSIAKVEPKEEITLPKQPSIPAGGDYNPSHPLMPVVLKYLGTPYIFGANSDRAVDCSAFVQKVFADLGMKVPRTSREQWAFFPATTKLLQGDLVFFSFGGKQIDHVGIYLGRNVFVHANSYESRVVIESLDAPTYKRVYRGGRSTNLGQILAAVGP